MMAPKFYKRNMQVRLVMTVIGKDRPGLVDLISQIVAGHGGNWLESRMCQLGGEFAGILRVQAPAERQTALEESLQRLQDQGLTVIVHVDQGEPVTRPKVRAALEIVGQDRPGIVHQIAHALASHGVNVEEFHSECLSAPMSGETLFKAQAKLQIPESCPLTELQLTLEKIASDLVVDLSLQPLQSA